MKISTHLAVSLVSALVAVSAGAQTINNWRSSDGTVWRNGSQELCWRNSSWTPATAAPGCDGAIAPAKPAPAPAPAPAPKPMPAPAPKAAPAPAPAPGPKQEPLSLVSLVNLKDRLTSSQVIEYLKQLVACQAKVSDPLDDIE